MKFLKQRVPVGFLKPDGHTVEINKEFGDDIERLVAEQVGTTVDLSSILAAISALQSQHTADVASLAALTARVQELENRWQS